MDSSSLASLELQRNTSRYSRSATVNSLARLPTPQSSNASTHSMNSPQLSSTQIACKLSSTSSYRPVLFHSPRPSPQPREGSLELRSSAMSSYLQEKLDKERKEGELSSRRTPDLGSHMDVRLIGSPSRMSTPSRDRGTPVQAVDGDNTKIGLRMGVKEMEVTVTTLHKQNFDLKLELYHRRERQQALESRLETVEGEKRQMEEMNDKLIEELEKRDKAVEEAVAMIVMLESQVENLLKERETIRDAESRLYEQQRRVSEEQEQIKCDRASRQHMISVLGINCKTNGLSDGRSRKERSLNRMPSFISDLSESTENLRSVYLNGAKVGSIMNLPKLNEALTEVEALENAINIPENLRSPSLSMLSESSFASVYGEKEDDHIQPLSPRTHHPTQHYASPSLRNMTPRSGGRNSRERMSIGTPTRGARSMNLQHKQIVNINSISGTILDQNSSLQCIGQSYSQRGVSGCSSVDSSSSALVLRSSKNLNKKYKRESLSLGSVKSDSPRILNDNGMPPTPDTISTATLRCYQNENDAMSRTNAPVSASPVTTGMRYMKHTGSNGSIGGVPVELLRSDVSSSKRSPQLSSVGMLPRSREVSGSYFDARPAPTTRPHSAGESTVARYPNKATYESDASDNDDDVQSLASSLDIWIREGGKPPRTLGGGGESPDLFTFPPHRNVSSGWGSASMADTSFEPPTSTMIYGTSPRGPPPPPPPNRRSSLNASTGPPHLATTTLQSEKQRSKKRRDEVSRPSSQPGVASYMKHSRSGSKNSLYPPSAQPQRSRGINNFWRRSIGSSGLILGYGDKLIQNNSKESIHGDGGVSVGGHDDGVRIQQQKQQPPRQLHHRESQTYGTAAWHRKNSLMNEDDGARATPPPIARNRELNIDPSAAPSKSEKSGLAPTKVPTTPRTPVTAVQGSFPPSAGHRYSTSVFVGQTTPSTPGSSKKGWLSRFGRSNSVSKKDRGSERNEN